MTQTKAPETLASATLAKLREPFPPHQISKLPKPYKRDSAKGKCAECGGFHGLPAVHLDYVGHAALTDRLLDVDPLWSWEPMGLTDQGLPAFDQRGGLWIRLTVLGMTRPGYGSADGKQGGDAVKEMIGDALRNAAMRFGAALDLWHKGDLHMDEDAPEGGDQGQRNGTVGPDAPDTKEPAHHKLKVELREFVRELEGVGDWDTYAAFRDTPDFQRLVKECEDKLPHWWAGWDEQPDGFVPLARRIEDTEARCRPRVQNPLEAG